MKKLAILFCLFLFHYTWSQTVYPMSQQNNGQTFTTCSGIFTDSGGVNGNYGMNENRTITFCPADPNRALEFHFTVLNIEDNWDFLYVYDGPTATGTPLHTYTGNLGTFTFISPTPGNCVTFQFTSDSSIVRAGWVADFACTCQTITPIIVSTNPPADTEGVVKICEGESVSFVGSATFSDSGQNAVYEWDFGNGQTATGQNVTATYAEGGVYVVSFKVTDDEGCEASINQIVQVSGEPDIEFTTDPETFCMGDEVQITANITPLTYEYDCTPPVSETTFLPDGSGVSYQTSVTVDCFPGEILSNINQIESVCINMEHSYSGDLDIVLVAPNGSQVLIYDQGGGSANFGIPWATAPVDGQSGNTTPGVGHTYCIIPGTANPTLNQGILTGGTFPAGNGPGTYTDSYFPEGNYRAVGSFASLIGTPLNGEWTIIVTDNLAADNGYLFEWSIDIGQTPAAYTFTPVIEETDWESDPTITNVAGNTITVNPPESGNYCYTVNVTDDFGCTYEATYCIDVNGTNAEFDLQTTYCFGDIPEELQNESENGVTGHWEPSEIDTGILGSTIYTFYPDEGQCAPELPITITVTEADLLPEFIITPEYCIGTEAPELPTESENGVTGHWEPSVIDTGILGSTVYTFYPDEGQCALDLAVTITITEANLLPEFIITQEYCTGTEAPELPTESENGVTGHWEPSVIDTGTLGSSIYTFYPDEGQCALELAVTITITEEMAVTYEMPTSYCQYETPVSLPSTLTNGVTGTWIPAIIDTDTPGTAVYTFYPEEGLCALDTPFTIEIYPQPVLNSIPTIELCDEDFDGIFETNLTDLNPELGGGTGIEYIYYGSLADFNADNPIPSGQWNNYNFPSLPATIYVVGESGEGCRSAEIPVQFIEGEEVSHNSGPFGPIEYCPEDTVDLTQFVGAIGAGGATLAYYNNLQDARNQTNEILNTSEFTPDGTQTSVIVRLDEDGFCSAFVEILLERLSTPSLSLSPTTMILCEEDSFEATATSDDPDATFEWTLGDGTILTGPVQTIDQIGTYTVIAYSADGCRSEERTLTVNLPSIPVINGLELGDNFIIVSASNNGEGALEYSLDGVLWQSSPQFSNLIPGETYTVWVRSSGCMIDKYEVTLLSVPNFISPNGDGKNDTWTIRGINATPGATLKIFDRYGKIFVDTNFEGNYEWNGKYLGNNVPSGDYWYIIQIPSDGIVQERKFVGHITVRNK